MIEDNIEIDIFKKKLNDKDEDINWLTSKIIGLRIFPDEKGIMNKNVCEVSDLTPEFSFTNSFSDIFRFFFLFFLISLYSLY